MQKDSIEINGVKYIRADQVQQMQQMADIEYGMRYCIVRCRDAGVHAGFIADHEGREVTLRLSRRLWRWHGRTLSGLAIEGTTDASQCKYAPEVPEIIVLDACEIIPCTQAGMESIRNMEPWRNE